MLGVEGYGSDDDSDNESQQNLPQQPHAAPKPAAKSSIGLSLPPPASAASGSKTSSGLSLPAPKKKGPKKITIGLPALSNDNDRDDTLDDQPPAKKARITAGAGSSTLFSMLPAPKNPNPVPERVLGGGNRPGLVFNTGVKRPATQTTVEDAEEEHEDDAPVNVAPLSGSLLEEVAPSSDLKQTKPPAMPFRPMSVTKGKANVSTEDRPTMSKAAAAKSAAPAMDFFSLGSTSSSTNHTPSLPSTSSVLPSISLSSAPKVDDFVPPEPTQTDPYPGYYLLPSGSWAAYEPAYYQKFYNRWKKEYDNHVRALEKGIEKGFEGLEKQGATEVNALAEMERAKVEIQEREEKKALTMAQGDAPAAPKMNIKASRACKDANVVVLIRFAFLQGAALSGRAKTRHQLSTLLTDAYQNREALEEQIAQARRNRKEAGNKYGEWWSRCIYESHLITSSGF
ncbi:hypothetical protein BDW22DRAFT_1442974 [Trametopsis cervina]|nr:hypothetical protein BDW22DRAFT_1442974 [Trametopsis cervina]